MIALRRASSLVLASALALSGVALTAPAATAAGTDPRPLSIGADWLAGQLTSGLIHNPNFGGFDDYGLSIDTGFALEAASGHASDVSAISAGLAANIDNYVTGDAFGDTGSSYAGATAKAAVFATSTGADPTSYGGENLVTRLEARVSGTAPITGRIEDASSFGDFANVIGQAFAVSALETASSPRAADALAFLLKQQCTAGYFRIDFTADKTATDQTCDGGIATGAGAADPDATSTAIRLLLPEAGTSPTVARAVGKAEAWLLAQQHADGSFSGGASTAVPNANSTGLAGWALGLLGDTDAATRAAVWVRQHQADEVAGCANDLSGQTGAIGYDDGGVAAGRTAGITDATSDQWRRATSQALPVLQWAPAATPAVSIQGPAGYVRAGSSATYLVTGALPGDKVCLTGLGAPVRGVAGAGGSATLHVTLPAGTATRTVGVTDRAADVAQTHTSVLGAKTFRVRLSRTTVVRGSLVRVTVVGLAPRELMGLRFRGVPLRTGQATPTGVYSVTFNVRRTLGKGTVVVLGQFPGIRHGSAVVTVVR